MNFTYEKNQDSLLFNLILNLTTRNFKTTHAIALHLNMTLQEVKNIFEKHNAIYIQEKYNAVTRPYFNNKQDAINCMDELNSILMSRLLVGDYNE